MFSSKRLQVIFRLSLPALVCGGVALAWQGCGGSSNVPNSDSTIEHRQGIRIDTLVVPAVQIDSICWLQGESFRPILQGFEGAEAWNDSIAMFYSPTALLGQVIQEGSFCASQDLRQQGEIEFPYSEGLSGNYSFSVLTLSSSCLSIKLDCSYSHNGGNMWTRCSKVLTFNPQNGERILFPPNTYAINTDLVNNQIRKQFEVADCWGGHSPYEAHELRDILEEGIHDERVGLEAGQWVLYQLLLPEDCPSVAKREVKIELGPFHVDSDGEALNHPI